MAMRFKIPILLFIGALLCSAAAWATPAEPVRIANITLHLEDVYPDSDGSDFEFFYELANKLHMRTREEVVRRELLFREGEVLSPELLEETERNLRRFRFLRHVRITATEPHAGRVDVHVHTIDAWTTKTQLNVGSSGGRLTGSGGIVEDNFLGRGKSLAAYYIVDSERTSTRLQYVDPRLLGRFLTLGLAYSTGEDLRRTQVYLTRPFHSSLTSWSYGLGLDGGEQLEYLYDSGEEAARFLRSRLRLEAFVARSLGSDPVHIRRARLGWRVWREDFRPHGQPGTSYLHTLPDEGRQYSGPFVGIELRRSRFLRERNINSSLRDEDFDLGLHLQAEAGLAAETLGSRRDALLLGLAAGSGASFGDGRFALGTARVSGRVEDGMLRNVHARLETNAYMRLHPRVTLAASLSGDWLHRPDPERQILLGGEEGLRGYKLRLFTGDKGMLGRLETRVLIVEDFLRLCSIGTTAFVDAGNVWPQGRPLDLLEQKLDVGAGLRFTFPRSSQGQILRVDLSYALDDNGFGSPWLISFGTVQSF
jgi:hypothetical protein